MAFVLPPFVNDLPAGVRQVSLPTPFRVGRVNCYLLVDAPVTVIDPGALQPGSVEELGAHLSSSDLGFGDIEQIVVTHAHADHFGAAATIAARSGARIVCGLPELTRLLRPRDPRPRHDLLARLGVPEEIARSLVASGDAALEGVVTWPDPSVVTAIGDGDILAAGGRQLVCVISSGHADGHLSLWDPAARVLFSGDHLLARIIPVPSLDPGDGGNRRHSFVEYLTGLPRFVAMDPTVVLPGHGRAFTEIGVLAARLRSNSQRRAEQIATILRDGPATTYEVARRLQSAPEGARLALVLAHAQGHLDLLEEAGRVIPQTAGLVVRYRLRSG